MEIKVPVAKLGMKKLELDDKLKEIAIAYMYRLSQESDWKSRIFKN